MKKEPLEWRFWTKVKISAGCWVWIGSISRKWGYGGVRVDGEMKLAHRVAYELLIGAIPEGMQLDHTCHNPACVNPIHLRVCTNTQNCMNKLMYKNNKSGFKGVHFRKDTRKWQAQIVIAGKKTGLGQYETPEEANAAYSVAALQCAGEFAYSGKVA